MLIRLFPPEATFYTDRHPELVSGSAYYWQILKQVQNDESEMILGETSG